VSAVEDFKTNSKDNLEVKQGMLGTVVRIDNDGDFLIAFEVNGKKSQEWVLQRHIHRVRVIEGSASTASVAVGAAVGVDGSRNERVAWPDGFAGSPVRPVVVRAADDGDRKPVNLNGVPITSVSGPVQSRDGGSLGWIAGALGSVAQVDGQSGLQGLLRSSVACSHAVAASPGTASAALQAQHHHNPSDGCVPPLVISRQQVRQEGSRSRSKEPAGQVCNLEPRYVWLHIYDVSGNTVKWMNNIIRPVGTGAFHAGVEVYGNEWSFGYALEHRTGVYNVRARSNTQHRYRESIPMGATDLTEAQVMEIMETLKKDWLGNTYDLLQRNCCHFSSHLCREFGVGDAPEWVMNLAGAGAKIVDGVDQAVASAQAARSLVAALDEEYQITPAVHALLSRDYKQDIPDEDYVREKAREAWASAIESIAPVGETFNGAFERAQKVMTLGTLNEGVLSLWNQMPSRVPAVSSAAAAAHAAGLRPKDTEVRIVKVKSAEALAKLSFDSPSDGLEEDDDSDDIDEIIGSKQSQLLFCDRSKGSDETSALSTSSTVATTSNSRDDLFAVSAPAPSLRFDMPVGDKGVDSAPPLVEGSLIDSAGEDIWWNAPEHSEDSPSSSRCPPPRAAGAGEASAEQTEDVSTALGRVKVVDRAAVNMAERPGRDDKAHSPSPNRRAKVDKLLASPDVFWDESDSAL